MTNSTENNPTAEAQKCKEEGNAAFKEGDWNTAISCYTKAIQLSKEDSNDKAVYYKNRAAAYLKISEYSNALNDCNAALEIVRNDPKALFRRCQALENLERFEEAYRDARQVHTVDPLNKAIQPVLERLHQIVQERLRENAQTSNRVAQMFKIGFDMEADSEKRETAMNNLVVLARERAGAEVMYQEGIVRQIGKLVKFEKKHEILLPAIRIIGELCKRSMVRTKGIVQELGIPWFLDVINCNHEERVNAAQYCIQTVLNSLSGMDNKPESKPVPECVAENKNEIDVLLSCLVYSTTSRTISGLARNAIIELITRNIHYTALDWAERLVEIKGLQRLMEVASELQEYKYETTMEITESTRTIVSVCLTRIYENMYYDQARERFLNNVDDYVKSKLITPDIESKVRVVVALTTLLLGPLDVGNTILAKEGIMEMILVMANTDDILQQKVACECIIAAASKKDKVKAIISQGVHILKKLYQSKDDSIRVRALVGLCKLGSSGGTDASVRPFAEGSTKKLAEACRRFLINPAKDRDMRRWAVEGLSYLTLDADVKEKLVEDRAAIRAMMELARTGDQSAVYGVVTTLVNLVNAYEKQEVIPEMIELAKFAKHHIPQEHELDDPDFVAKRLEVLANEGVTSALVALSKTDSQNSKELISRVFNALCSQQDLRGIVVQQGGVKVLLSMALDGTDKGKKQAAQALARIGITIAPEVAFPGQRCVEVVRPLLASLHLECSGLENFEALMALCNVAGASETVRQRIVKEGGIPKIETYMYEQHEMLRRAATQAMTNMVMSPDVVKMYEGNNDRVKYITLLCSEEDVETSKAAAGALAILTSVSKKVCRKVFQPANWLDILHQLLANPDKDIQHRGVVIVSNMIHSCKDVAEKLVETDITEILMALSIIREEGKEKIREYAEEALRAAEQWKLIKKPGEEGSDDDDVE
ncbi:protein unc-45 homolog B [Anabrus simplex]|uniref:protein unc-45 homolog B n=1 Tax=Anabrus simplex TaxID=316456 RepID=UPI0035A32FFD